MDKRVVAALSTIDDDSMVEIQRTSACQEGIETIQKPAIIHNYNTYMGGVDKADQLVTYYGFPHFFQEMVETNIFPHARYHPRKCLYHVHRMYIWSLSLPYGLLA